MTRILLLDAGNSRLKWAVVDATLIAPGDHERLSESLHWRAQGAAAYGALEPLPSLWAHWGPLSHSYAIRVVDDETVSAIEHILAQIDLQPVWLKTRAQACGVTNRYIPPESLGVDRWAALLAARQRQCGATLVISAGSALTVDALQGDGQFLGGLIVPGLQTMRLALTHSTAQLGMQYGQVRDLPACTADAVESGIIAACQGAIATMRDQMEKHCGARPSILLTGGDAPNLAPFLPPGFVMVPGLVLEGVYHMALEDETT